MRAIRDGSYSGKAENNPEALLAMLVDECELTYEKGDLTELFKKEKVAKRTMDFIIPNKKNPKIIIESSFLVTTSSGQGDKSKTEGTIKNLFPNIIRKQSSSALLTALAGMFAREI